MLVYPNIDPVAFHLGPLSVRWYGLMYLLGFGLAWWLGARRALASGQFSSDAVGDIIFYAALGVILGGRLGYMLFYSLPALINTPWSLFQIWQGGMSFHGGLIGVLIALAIWSWRQNKPYLLVMDFVAPLVPLGLAAGRLGNFLNGELWGRVTFSPVGMLFPDAGPFPRYPSQLIEFFLEGVCLFLILWFYSAKPRQRGRVSGMFLLFYGVFRIFAEFFRQPDPQLGYLLLDRITMGQLLSLPMILFGLWLCYRSSSVAKPS